MLGLDTNVLVRYIVQDDPDQAKKANQVIDALKMDDPAFISCIVLCELNWVLKSAYKISKDECVSVLRKVLSIGVFEIEQLESCLQALKRYENGAADFSDYLIQDIASTYGCETLLTFDKNALKSEGFQKL